MEKSKGLIAEFKEFINQGNAMDMAVGVIIGGAFTAIVNSLIDDIINPVISIVTGGGEVGQGLSIQIGSAVINFGSLIGAIINFLLIALVVFVMVKSMNTMKEKTAALMKSKEAEEEEPEAEPEPSEEILLLREIRDSLAAKNQ
ncbi:MAG: large conductance mechanosensitive channel protein MscL [Eggerthellaceae bacterium]|nr:large conductance mechanosensitive channel protein MscL [Eggerthellaceae bacterium]MDY5370881.1 large conductance mechanosensitive channel protein MscL [Eggerthellaceae bacterium]